MVRAQPLVIFDCDGVLVDSEPLSVKVLVEQLNRKGVAIDETQAYARFLGRSLSTVAQILHDDYDHSIDAAFLNDLRHDLYDRFRQELKPVAGIAETLDAMDWPRCVASSSQPERIRLSLSLTGLLDRLEPHIFSATMVSRGKPAPDLFLHAAEEMGADPSACIVIEDSPAGIEAAKRAGMTVFAFVGGSHSGVPGYRDRVTALVPDAVFDAMPELIHLVRKHMEGPGGRLPQSAV
ncbi:HAD family hydrolase [Neorhizobium sp. T786]|uniref:HAD family hydrolase n=1 Tax=Pseudorhizobium xiangyangii TaxID=2883104 RepID=UPI001CFF8209|nr:HAD family hydrolase [Neorhizobium xiangyangii]MCB5203705.1 HAD family hydrolase [Neorhizobium xiangyangii]